MERFLSQCAKYIYQKHKNELHHICLVFPNRRAGVFFNSYLQNEIEKAVIAPQTTTIGELISGYSTLFQAEKLQLISLLYEVFQKHTHTNETFDAFYFWGEILLADFNDIDRYLVNARDLFTNISDLKEIETIFDYLTGEQNAALTQFWGAVAVDGRKTFQQQHLLIWEKLYPVYVEFKEILKSKNLAYSGMIDREVVENQDQIKPEFAKYYFIGLNALNTCEKKFYRVLQQAQKAVFLWDYDHFYLDDKMHEAGKFMRDNLVNFPPPSDFICNTQMFVQPKNFKMVAVSSNYGQSQQIPHFVEETVSGLKTNFDSTAIVLADETLLFSALGAIPPDIETVNITMGYPVKNSMIFGFLMLLVNLLKNTRFDEERGPTAYHRLVTNILNHQLIAQWHSAENRAFVNEIQAKNMVTIQLSMVNYSPIHKQIFSVPNDVSEYSNYFLSVLEAIHSGFATDGSANAMISEIISTVYQSVEKLRQVIEKVGEEQHQTIGKTVYFRLFSQFIGAESVAFEGEPLSGLQVMGILETRCLDFENVIVLGFNENKWPRTSTAPSFIAASIRKGFGLPGIDEQDAMYAYYFYRLMQRAKNITTTYSVVREGISTGEMSRYGYQLQYGTNHNPEKLNLDFSFANDTAKPIEIASSNEIVEGLLEKNTSEHPLSPSAINIYLQCKLRFYFRYIMELPESDEVQEEIDGMIFGNIFHETIEKLYTPFIGKTISVETIERILQNQSFVESVIRQKIAKNFFKIDEEKAASILPEGKMLLIQENMKTYLNKLLEVDKKITPFTLISLENSYVTPFQVLVNQIETNVFIGGKIDRIDQLNGIKRIIDYKTGNVNSLTFKEVAELFNRDIKDHKKEILQALIYTFILAQETGETNIIPAVYGLRKLFSEPFKPEILRENKAFSFHEIEHELIENLALLVSEIYNRENTFTQTENFDVCAYCAYKAICQR